MKSFHLLAALLCVASSTAGAAGIPSKVGIESQAASAAATPRGVATWHSADATPLVFGESDRVTASPASLGKSVSILERLSGAWFNPQQTGHGFSINVSGTTVAVAWYVFLNGQQVWLVGAGTFNQTTNTVTMQMVRPIGGQFLPNFSSSQVTNVPWGQLTLTVQGCDSITASWQPTDAGFGPGSLQIQPVIRVSGDCGFAGTSTPPPNTGSKTLNFTNQLIASITFTINGGNAVTVPAGGTATRTIQASSLAVAFTINTATNTGLAIGQLRGGTFSTINDAPATSSFTVNNIVGNETYFSPVILNNSSVSLLFGVNMGLQAENRCDCTGAPGSNSQIGYYRLFSNSNVRAYRTSNGYTGTYLYWGSDPSGSTAALSTVVQQNSGQVNLTATTAP